MSERSKRVKSFFHEKINFIYVQANVLFSFYCIYINVLKIKKKLDEKQRNDVSEIFASENIENM